MWDINQYILHHILLLNFVSNAVSGVSREIIIKNTISRAGTQLAEMILV